MSLSGSLHLNPLGPCGRSGTDSEAGRRIGGPYRQEAGAPQGSWIALKPPFSRPIRPPAAPAGEGPMDEEEILAEFRAAEALLEGHFILSSGLHSPRYLQCARVLMDPARASRLASALAATMPREIRSRDRDRWSRRRWAGSSSATRSAARSASRRCSSSGRPGTFELRRGFRLAPGQKVLLVEDVVTTGLSSREAIARGRGGRRRGDRRRRAGRPLERRRRSRRALLPADPPRRPGLRADALPPELAALPAEKPGSRKAA